MGLGMLRGASLSGAGWRRAHLTRALNRRHSDGSKSVCRLAVTGPARGCSYLQQQSSKYALSNAVPGASEAGNLCQGQPVVGSSQCVLLHLQEQMQAPDDCFSV